MERNLKKIKLLRSDVDRVFSAVREGKFEGRCGADNLPEILKIFRFWAEGSSESA